MEYKIVGQTVPVVEMKLNAGETVYTQSGGMAYQNDGIEMSTNARGGIMKGIGRMLMEKLEEYAKSINAKKLIVPASITGCEFYHKLGYKYKNNKKELDKDKHYMLEKTF